MPTNDDHYLKIALNINNSKLRHYFNFLKCEKEKEGDSQLKCSYCKTCAPEQIECRLVSKKNMIKCGSRKQTNVSCKARILYNCLYCGKKKFSNTLKNTKYGNPLPNIPQDQNMTPLSKSAKKRVRKSGSKLQQQLQQNKLVSNCKSPKVSLADFLSLS